MSGFEPFLDPNLIYGTNPCDDTGVYKLREDLAIVQTVDFFTPIVDDPFDFGQIAAANALSDCYTIGANPVTALSLVSFPCHLGMDILSLVLAGGSEKVRESGAVILGGHSVDDQEPKYGIAVTGVIDPKDMVLNNGAKPGDKLILTKKIGTGIVTNINKKTGTIKKISRVLTSKNSKLKEGVFDEAVDSMKTLNKISSEVMCNFSVNACTDVTGFGLLGHLHNILEASGASAKISFSNVPTFEGILSHAIAGTAGGGERNREWTCSFVSYSEKLDQNMIAVLNDAQTSGGLIIAVEPSKSEEMLQELILAGSSFSAIIGEVIEGEERKIIIDL